jgi:hypothetical protein
VCQEAQKESRESKIFYNEISVSYEYGLSGLNESSFGQPLFGRSVKLLTTFLGKIFPLCGRKVHTFTTEAPAVDRVLRTMVEQAEYAEKTFRQDLQD